MIKIRDEVISMIREAIFVSAPVAGTSNLYTDLGLDSLSFVHLLVKIEETYSIKFGLLEMEMCLQVDRLIALVENKVKEPEHDSTSINESRKPGKNCDNRR